MKLRPWVLVLGLGLWNVSGCDVETAAAPEEGQGGTQALGQTGFTGSGAGGAGGSTTGPPPECGETCIAYVTGCPDGVAMCTPEGEFSRCSCTGCLIPLEAGSCTWVLEGAPLSVPKLDTTRTFVKRDADAVVPLPHVADSSMCGPEGGWWVEGDAKRLVFTLCPESCTLALEPQDNPFVLGRYDCPVGP